MPVPGQTLADRVTNIDLDSFSFTRFVRDSK
jgi:hypothetical protein